MKKSSLLMALLAMVGMARADKVFVNDITLPQGEMS